METAPLLVTYVDKVLKEVVGASIITGGEISGEKLRKPR